MELRVVNEIGTHCLGCKHFTSGKCLANFICIHNKVGGEIPTVAKSELSIVRTIDPQGRIHLPLKDITNLGFGGKVVISKIEGEDFIRVYPLK